MKSLWRHFFLSFMAHATPVAVGMQASSLSLDYAKHSLPQGLGTYSFPWNSPDPGMCVISSLTLLRSLLNGEVIREAFADHHVTNTNSTTLHS